MTGEQPFDTLPAQPEAVDADTDFDEVRPLPLAGFWRRTGAFIFDFYVGLNLVYCVVVAVALLVALAVEGFILLAGDPTRDLWLSIYWLAGMIVVMLCVAIPLYFVVLESSAAQATPGKYIFGIRVVAGQDKVSLRRAAGRLLALVPTMFTVGLGFVIPLLRRPRGVPLQDRMSGTRVVIRPRDRRALARDVVVALVLVGTVVGAWPIVQSLSFSANPAIQHLTYGFELVLLLGDARQDACLELPDLPWDSDVKGELAACACELDEDIATLTTRSAPDEQSSANQERALRALRAVRDALRAAAASAGTDDLELQTRARYDLLVAAVVLDDVLLDIGEPLRSFSVSDVLIQAWRQVTHGGEPEVPTPSSPQPKKAWMPVCVLAASSQCIRQTPCRDGGSRPRIPLR